MEELEFSTKFPILPMMETDERFLDFVSKNIFFMVTFF